MPKTAILIDDDQDDLELLKETIKGIDNTVLCRSFIYSEEALRVVSAKVFTPNYIFIDINMPGLSGDKLLKRFRENNDLDDTVITILSTSIPETVSQSLKAAGANYTFQKPSKVKEYEAIIRQIFR